MRSVGTLLLLLFCLSPRSGIAQLRDGSLAPNIVLKDVNGNVQDLYSYLDQGKTVFLEFFTTWCPPCRAYHMEGHLDSLYREHGPLGYPGVNANTTNDIMVLMVEVEYANTWQDLYGGTSGGYDWVTGTPYPICDTPGAPILSIVQGYDIEYIPTTFMVCRDRLTKQLVTPSAVEAYSLTNDCPHYPPSASVDAKAAPYQDKQYFFCQANPKVRFQNYSESSNITNATIRIKSGASTVYTYQWAGNLAPYQVATVNIPSFSPAAFIPYTYEVDVPGDSYSLNNRTEDSIFKVYGGGNALSLPDARDYEEPDPRLSSSGGYAFTPFSQWWDSLGALTNLIGTDGAPTTALLALPGRGILGNYNTTNVDHLGIQFDYSELCDPHYPDTLMMEVSSNCGFTWDPIWGASGNELLPPVPYLTSQQYPAEPGNWKHFNIDISGYQSANLLLRVRFRGEYSWGFFDNLKVTPWSTGVATPEGTTSMQVYPNPVTDVLNIQCSAPGGEIEVLDMMGQVVVTSAYGNGKAALDISRLSHGVYVVRLKAEDGYVTRKFVKE